MTVAKLAALAASIVGAIPCAATAKPYLLTSITTDAAQFADLESVKLMPGGTRRMWINQIAAPNKDIMPPARISVVQAFTEFDCSGSRVRLLASRYFGEDLKVVTTNDSPDAEWTTVFPGGAGEEAMTAACAINEATEATLSVPTLLDLISKTRTVMTKVGIGQ